MLTKRWRPALRDIYAAGDVASVNGADGFGLWQPADRTGLVEPRRRRKNAVYETTDIPYVLNRLAEQG